MLTRNISTHSLTRRLTRETLPVLPVWWHFNSQPHKEADAGIKFAILRVHHFNSQPHKEADQLESYYFLHSQYFNSQPHKEADVTVHSIRDIVPISTHSLTRRLTHIQHIPA